MGSRDESVWVKDKTMGIENNTRGSRDKTTGIRPGRAEMRPCGAEETSVKNTRSTGSSMGGRAAERQPHSPGGGTWSGNPVERFLSILDHQEFILQWAEGRQQS